MTDWVDLLDGPHGEIYYNIFNKAFNMSEIEFRKFPKIPRYENLEVQVTEKLDGTNGVVHITMGDPWGFELHFGSRNKWLSEDDDNFDFFKFGQENAKYLYKLGPGYHYGEYCGPGIQKNRYNLTERKFFLFDTRKKDMDLGPNITTVPHLMTISLKQLDLLALNSEMIRNKVKEGLMLFIPELNQRIKVIFNK